MGLPWWLRIHLAMQGTQVPSLDQEDPHELRSNKAHVPQILSRHSRACKLQLLTSVHLEAVLRTKRRHLNEKPMRANEEWTPLATTRERPYCSNENPPEPKLIH